MTAVKTAVMIVAAAIFALTVVTPPPVRPDDVYTKMANDFAKYSANKKVKNLAVLGFARKARTSREESEYVSEKLLSCLVESGKVNLLERSQLDKVLEERRLAAAGVADEPQPGARTKIDTTDAIIVGTIFGTKDHLKIIAKMIDPLTGAVLHTVEAQTDRQWEILPERPEFEFEVPDLEAIAAMFGEQEFKPEFTDFRDAPASLGTETCNARKAKLAGRETALMDAKAKYWALEMRDPGFDSARLRNNPGAEVEDPAERRAFYRLVDMYYKAPAPVMLTASEMDSVMSLMKEEGGVSDDCGLR